MRPHPPPPSEATPWLAGRGLTTHDSHALQTSSNWRILKHPSTTPVTNVVKPSQKTSIFNEKGVGLTTFVTTTQESARKTPRIDDVCNKTLRATHQRPGPTGTEGAGGTGGPGCGARGRWRGLARLRDDAQAHVSTPGPTGVEGAGGTGGHGREGLAAVPVGGGRARAGLEIDHSEPQARVWRSRGRAAAHRHTQRPGPTAGPSGARNTSGATQRHHAVQHADGWGASRHPTRQHQ